MGLNKIEKKFKNQLDQREIKPSPAAWDRLDAMLTVAEEKKVKPIYNWIYIAASIVGFLAIGYIFLNNPTELVDVKRNEVVIDNNVPTKPNDSIVKQQQSPIQIQKEEVIAESSISNQNERKSITHPKKIKSQFLEQKNQIANKNSIERPNEKSIINQKTNEINSNQPIQITNETQIATAESKLKNPTIKVNASNLLSEVDNELELSFREKVIRKIDKNYKTVKIALANRNQQSNTN